MSIKFKKILKYCLLILLILFFLGFYYFFIGQPKPAEKIIWGVNFSQKHSEDLGLDWQNAYLAILDDLMVKNLKISVPWDLIETEEGSYNFDDLDWQIGKAEEKNVKIILVIGMKTGRWPECHEPEWVRNQKSKIKNQKSLLEYIEKIVNRYKDSQAIWAWQVENEPFFPFGECPWEDKEFLKKEVELVKSLDQYKPIIISDTGEWSFWLKPAKIGDIVGVTMYKMVWSKEVKSYFSSFLPPVFYHRRAFLIKKIYNKDVICVELQAEPWCPNLLYNCSMEEQKKTMDLEQFRKNIEFAQKTGLKEFYLWGAEWWYWMKEQQNKPEFWEAAKKLF